MTKIAILVLNYNGRKHLEGFLASGMFLRHEQTADVIVVDNASCDDSLEFVRKSHPWVKIVRNDSNYGWGEGYNQGIARLIQAGHVYSHYMFINNDVFPDETWYRRLLAAVESAPADIGEIGCRAVFAAPFLTEEVAAVVHGDANQLAWRFTTSSDHDLFEVQNRGGVVQAVIRASTGPKPTPGHLERHLSTPERGAESHYGLIVENTGGSPVELDLRPHLSVARTVPIADDFTLAVLRKNPGERRVKIESKSRIVMLRLVMPGEPLRYLIQNSGIGLNERFEGYDLHAYDDRDTRQKTDLISGICGVCKTVTREAFESVGGFDTNYFMYYEDLDFSLRVKAKGYKTLLAQDAVLRHVHAGSSKARSPFFERQVTWSRYYFQFLHAGFFRRLKTWLSFQYYALIESRAEFHRMSAPHVIALDKFRKAFFRRSYVLGPKRVRS